MNKILILIALATFGYSEEASKLSQADQSAIDKAIESSLAEPQKAYQAYQAALTKAQDKAIKDLEKLKAGAMKGNNLPLAVAIDGKIAEVKKGGLGEIVVAKSGSDLLGDEKKVVATWVVGSFTAINGNEFKLDQKNGKYILTEVPTGYNSISSKTVDGKLVFQWSNGNDILVLEKKDSNFSLSAYSHAFKGTLEVPKATPAWSVVVTYK